MKIGIDLGTTYSAAAYIKDGKPQPIENSEGEETTPSVVLFEDDGSVTVGSDAKERALIELRFFRGWTQTQTAEKLGVSQVQVSRKEKKILHKMREALQT